MNPADQTYTVRANAFSPAKTYRIAAEGLAIGDDAGPPRLIPWQDIGAVDLVYAATRYADNRYLCRLQLRSGVREELVSCSYEGFAKFRDQATAFNAFVRRLHEILAARGTEVRFGRDESPWMQRGRWAVMAGLVAMVLVLAVVMVQQGFPRWLTAVKLLLILAMLPALLRWVQRSRGGRYDPRAIPAMRLPSEESVSRQGGTS
jgi:hypothetical protein